MGANLSQMQEGSALQSPSTVYSQTLRTQVLVEAMYLQSERALQPVESPQKAEQSDSWHMP